MEYLVVLLCEFTCRYHSLAAETYHVQRFTRRAKYEDFVGYCLGDLPEDFPDGGLTFASYHLGSHISLLGLSVTVLLSVQSAGLQRAAIMVYPAFYLSEFT